MSTEDGHGVVSRLQATFTPFTQILGARSAPYDARRLAALAAGMARAADDVVSDGPDAEENLYMPAGYTYLGQFVDHDLTLDVTSTLNPDDVRDPARPRNDPSNLRSPRFDLDCVYGTGPDDQPYMYVMDASHEAEGLFAGASLIIGSDDLARAANGRAIIGDKRNDENSIVNQLHQVFVRFHNQVVATLAAADASRRGRDLFVAARDEVRWAYQKILVEDFLPRIVGAEVIGQFGAPGSGHRFQLYPDDPDGRDLRRNLPREFVAAAYRFGHSAVRTGYRLNGHDGPSNGLALPVFTNPIPLGGDTSLVGFGPLPRAHRIDHWGRFFPGDFPKPGERLMANPGPSAEVNPDGTGGEGALRLQYAYKIDTSLSEPLTDLPPPVATADEVFPPDLRPEPPKGPSLALLNLLRGNRYELQGGQAYARKIGVPPLPVKYLVVRQRTTVAGQDTFTFVPISSLPTPDGGTIGSAFDDDTPLWFYVLAEAQAPLVDFWLDHGRVPLTENQLKGLDPEGRPPPRLGNPPDPAVAKQQLLDTRCAGTQLGQVGGRLVLEVFHGLLESDPDSYLNSRRKAPGWKPIWGPGRVTMARLLAWTDPARAPT